MQTKICYRHIDNKATRSCYQCKRAICKQCQNLLDGHYFCGYDCYREYQFIAFRKSFALWTKGVIKSSQSSIEEFKKRPDAKTLFRHWIFSGIWIFLIIVLSVMAVRKFMPSFKPSISAELETKHAEVKTAGIDLEFPEEAIFKEGRVISNRIDIQGEAPENYVVALYINGKLMNSTVPKNRKFLFKDVQIHLGKNDILVRAFSEGGEAYVLQRANYEYSNPTIDYLARNFKRGNTELKKVALTFDGGSEANATEEILDVLRETKIRSTMFLTGEYIRRNTEYVKRMIADGHEIGNHTYNHPHLTTFEKDRRHNSLPRVNRDFIHDQLKKTEEIFFDVTGRTMHPFWRAPYGEHNLEIRRWSAEMDYRHVGWTTGRNWDETMDTIDWLIDENSPAYHTSEEVLNKILSLDKLNHYGANGGIILMHLGTQRKKEQVHLRLREMIRGLREQGYELVTISELLND